MRGRSWPGGMWHRWSWLVVLVVGVILFEAVRRVLGATGNPNLLPSLILLGAAVAPATFVTFVAGLRLDYDIGLGTVALVAFVGGVVGVVAAGLLEYDTLQELRALPMVFVGLIEESAKLIGPLMVVLLTRYRRLVDGLLVGVASGAGFAALETMGYGFVSLIQAKGDLAALDQVLLLRGLLSPAAHMAWTGLTATALWYAAAARWRPSAVLRFLAVFAVAVGLHTAWDSLGGLIAYLVLAVVSLGLLVIFARRLGREGRVARRQARHQAATPTSS